MNTNLFYVDDDQDDLEFFQEAMESIGEQATLFTVGDDMIKAMHSPPPAPSVVFLDLNMPIKSGFELVEEIKASKAFSHLPLIIYSTANDQATIDRCNKLGASLYVPKPTSIKELQDVLKYIINIDWETWKPTPANFLYKH
jgi:CheY-like chemotaxis protein